MRMVDTQSKLESRDAHEPCRSPRWLESGQQKPACVACFLYVLKME
jgi:hypothetical protein